MPSETGADRLLRALRRRGVDTLFGLCGDHVNPIFVAARRHGIRIVDVRHESAAVHMADGYARTSSRIGVSIVTGGPGHTNSVTGIATAAAAGSPVIAISGSYEPEQRGKLAFQEMDQAGIVEPLAKSSRLLTRPEELDEAIGAAFNTALSGRPGPAHLSIPLGLLTRQVDEAQNHPGAAGDATPAGAASAGAAPGPSPDAAAVADLLRRLRAAERPILIVGSGGFWAGAQAELTRFVEATSIPCFTVDLARGLLPDTHPLCFGYADPVLNAVGRAFVEADFILVIGKRLDFRLGFGGARVFSPQATLAQVDIQPSELERNRPAQIRIVADARETLASLAALAVPSAREVRASRDGAAWPEKRWVGHLRRLREAWRESCRDGETSDASPVHPLRICREAREILDEETVLVFDGGDWPQWPRMSLQARRPGHWIRLGALGTVGAGLPLALGAQTARPGQKVILFIGDGGMGFHLAELHTAVRHRLNVVFVIGNDQGWGMEREIQSALYGGEAVSGCELGAVRYGEIARAFGAHGEEVARASDIRPALERAFAAGRPAVVDIALRKGSVSPLTAASIAAKRV